MRSGGAPLLRSASSLLSLSDFSLTPMASHALRVTGSSGPCLSLRGAVQAFQGLFGASSWMRERACSGERVPGCSSAAFSGRLFVPYPR